MIKFLIGLLIGSVFTLLSLFIICSLIVGAEDDK